MAGLRPFHLAFPVHDLAAARHFWGEVMGCAEGPHSARCIDFDFRGHQIVTDLSPDSGDPTSNPVDGKEVPVPHFGIILEMDDWKALVNRLTDAGVSFQIEPHIRFEGQVGEQATMFFLDPCGNALEFKAFGDLSQVFAK